MPDDKAKTDHSDDPNIARDDVYEAEQLALKTGITGDQAQELIDRIGSNRAALEEAARQLRARDG